MQLCESVGRQLTVITAFTLFVIKRSILFSEFECVVNCSQTKFVAIILVLSVFFLCDFSLDQFFV